VKVAIIGAGFVGTPTAVVLAERGHEVSVIEADEERARALREQRPLLYEDGLEEALVDIHLGIGLGAKGSLDVYLRGDPVAVDALAAADVTIVCVGTPTDGGHQNDTALVGAVEDWRNAIGDHAPDQRAIVIKSTVLPGTCRRLLEGLRDKWGADWSDLYHSPEFLAEGTALADARDPSRVVIGAPTCGSLTAVHLVQAAMAPFNRQHLTTLENAETTKYASNCLLAARLSALNDLARVCASVGADAVAVARLAGEDPRIGSQYLSPGGGWGGSCFPKDVQALVSMAVDRGISVPSLSGAIVSNEEAKNWAISQFWDTMSRPPLIDASVKVAVLGLTFKPGTNDTRESPPMEFVWSMVRSTCDLDNMEIVLYDPTGTPPEEEALVSYADGLGVKVRCADVHEAVEGAHVLVLGTAWEEVAGADLRWVASVMEDPRVVLDTRRMWSPYAAGLYGLDYRGFGLGRAS